MCGAERIVGVEYVVSWSVIKDILTEIAVEIFVWLTFLFCNWQLARLAKPSSSSVRTMYFASRCIA
jgi:hypothetical protein